MSVTPLRVGPRSNSLAIVLTVLMAGEVGAVEWGGYFRAGPGGTDQDGARVCYGLPGPGLKYRLGNECDFYGEFLLSQTLDNEGVQYSANLMTSLFNAGTDTDSARLEIAQMYVEATGFDVAPITSFWIGKRFYGRRDVHIVDTFFTALNGVGAGADNIFSGVGSLNLAYFTTDGTEPIMGVRMESGTRMNADWTKIAVNPGGTLRVVGTATQGDFDGGQSGLGLTFQHDQEDILGLGLNNVAWLQFAQGSAGLDSNFGDLREGNENKRYRFVESVDWQSGQFGGQAMAMVQTDEVADGEDRDSISVGGRGTYALTNSLKLIGELGFSQTKPDGFSTQKLRKATVAVALSTGPAFFDRPELRLYLTDASWNDAANEAAGDGGITGLGNAETDGTSFGAQIEIWF